MILKGSIYTHLLFSSEIERESMLLDPQFSRLIEFCFSMGITFLVLGSASFFQV